MFHVHSLTLRVLISLQRPPPHFNMFTSGPAHPHSVTRPDDITQQAEPAEEWDGESHDSAKVLANSI